MSLHEPSYLAGQSQAHLALAEAALRDVTVSDKGEHQLRAEALRAIDALKHRIVNRFDDDEDTSACRHCGAVPGMRHAEACPELHARRDGSPG